MKEKPQPGDQIYVPSAFYVYRGEVDFVGGLATISDVKCSDNLSEDHPNYIFVAIEENKNSRYNYKSLLEQQEELKEKFGNQKAYPSPDHSSEFNKPNADWQEPKRRSNMNFNEKDSESPEEKARRKGVPLIPKKEWPEPKDPQEETVAICGECGREVKKMEFYSCDKSNCPVQIKPKF